MTIRLLVPFDDSPAALHAVELVARYAGERSALEARLLNVQSEEALIDAGRSTLEPALSGLASAGIPAQAEVRVGLPAETILREAAAQKAEAVVMGTRGAGALHGFALGSVALRVAHGDGPPVILVKPQDRLPAALGKRLAAWRSWLGELDVQLVYVQRPLTVLEAVLPPHDDVMEQWSTTEAEQAAQGARELFRRERIAHHLHITVGDPAMELCALAASTSSDLLALGTRGLGAAHHALVGSVALKAAASSPVPVLLVH